MPLFVPQTQRKFTFKLPQILKFRFYETTNIIDIYILNKPSCPTWNGGNAAVGIQNDAGTEAFVSLTGTLSMPA
mgnify:CR=1 FL=1